MKTYFPPLLTGEFLPSLLSFLQIHRSFEHGICAFSCWFPQLALSQGWMLDLFCIWLPAGVFNTHGTCRGLDVSWFLEHGQSLKLLWRYPGPFLGGRATHRLSNVNEISRRKGKSRLGHPSSSQHAEDRLAGRTHRGVTSGRDRATVTITSPPGHGVNGSSPFQGASVHWLWLLGWSGCPQWV